MKRFKTFAVALVVMLLFALLTFAVAEVPTLPMSAIQWDVLYADEGDLGDESLPLPLLCGFAALTATGAVVVHKRRTKI